MSEQIWRLSGVRVIAQDDARYGQEGFIKDRDEYGAIFVRFPNDGYEGAWYTPGDLEPLPENVDHAP